MSALDFALCLGMIRVTAPQCAQILGKLRRDVRRAVIAHLVNSHSPELTSPKAARQASFEQTASLERAIAALIDYYNRHQHVL